MHLGDIVDDVFQLPGHPILDDAFDQSLGLAAQDFEFDFFPWLKHDISLSGRLIAGRDGRFLVDLDQSSEIALRDQRIAYASLYLDSLERGGCSIVAFTGDVVASKDYPVSYGRRRITHAVICGSR